MPANGDIILAATGTATSGTKGKTVHIRAYNGGIMTVPGWGPVVVDLDGLNIDGQIKLASDHDTSRKGLIGYGTATVRASILYVEGMISQATEAGREIIALNKDGFEFQASVGVEPKRHERIRAGTAIPVNGQTIKSDRDFILVTAATLREVSIVGLGCDSDTQVKIAASKGRWKENQTMPQTEECEAKQVRAAERDRLERINAKFNGLTSEAAVALRASAVAEEISEAEMDAQLVELLQDERELAIMRASRAPVGGGIAHNVSPQPTQTGDVMVAGLLNLWGFGQAAEKMFGGRTMQQAIDLRARTLADIGGHFLRASGRGVGGGSSDVLRAAFSTNEFAGLVETAMAKVVLTAYLDAPATWTGFVNIIPVADFKPVDALRPSFLGRLQEVGANGEIKHGYLSGEKASLRAGTFGQILRLSRQAAINDGGVAFAQAAAALARNARRKVNDGVYGTILGNAGSFFDQANDNLLTGATSALSVESLGQAIQAMLTQRDADGEDLDMRPTVLVVPPALRESAIQIVQSELLARFVGEDIDQQPTGNPHRQALSLAVEPRLGNSDKFDGASDTAWYLFAAPAAAAVNLGFLEGRQTPTVETFGLDSEAETLGWTWRVYIDFGVGLGDYRAAVKSNGK